MRLLLLLRPTCEALSYLIRPWASLVNPSFSKVWFAIDTVRAICRMGVGRARRNKRQHTTLRVTPHSGPGRTGTEEENRWKL
eukprot:scaffold41911_cov31-Tisochrysis_lutea.AAC.5